MGYWKSKVVPKIKKIFDKDSGKKAAAAEACKSFDDSKEEINKEFEEKKGELQPKVLEIYETLSVEVKTLVKAPKESGLRKQSAPVQKFLEELDKIGFPGSKPLSEACSKYGAGYVSGPVVFILEKVSTFIVEEKAVEAPPPPPEAAAAATEETKEGEEAAVRSEIKEKEAAVEEEIKTQTGKVEEEAKKPEVSIEPPKAE